MTRLTRQDFLFLRRCQKNIEDNMKISKIALNITLVLISLLLLVGCSTDSQQTKNLVAQKVVYHVNNINQSFNAFRNVKNHLNAVGDKNIKIIVVTHSSGAFALVEGAQDKHGRAFESSIQHLANRGVRFEICANTIRGKNIDKSKINLNAHITPSGITRVANLQRQGFVYVKP